MSLPCRPQIFNGLCKRLIRISKVYGGLILAAIGVQSVAAAESMGIVISNDRSPGVGVQDFELNCQLGQSAAAPSVRAAQADFAGDDINQPASIPDWWTRDGLKFATPALLSLK